jgi:hypothetical protein
MAKLTYLQLTNRILKRITLAEISDVTAATGTQEIVTELINEAQNEIWTEDNWYSLYRTRTFLTETYTASTISFAEANPDTIDDSASGFGSFQAGQAIYVTGSTSNDGTYTIATAAAGTLTLQTADDLATEAAGDSVTITAMSYPVPSDWGRTLSLVDVTNNRILFEDDTKSFDIFDPDANQTGIPEAVALEGDQYKLFPIPAGDYTIRERYWKIPDTLSANANTSDLPIECENAIIQYALMRVLEYLNKFEASDRARIEFQRHIEKAKAKNKKMIDKMNIMGSGGYPYHHRPFPPKLPSKYGHPLRYW